jgi:hypothetical protein
MGFVPQPVLAAIVAALATVASLSCADSHRTAEPALSPEPRESSSGQSEGPVLDVVGQPDHALKNPGVARRASAAGREQAKATRDTPGRA